MSRMEIGEIRVEEITDPLYLPLKRGGLVCPPLEGPMISNELEKEWNLWEIKLIIRGRKNPFKIRISSADE